MVNGSRQPGQGLPNANPATTTRFKKGQSGNPAGKKKGSKSFETIILERASKSIVVVNQGGKVKRMSCGEAVFEQLFSQVILKGDLKAAKLLTNLAREFMPHELESDPAGVEVKGRYFMCPLEQQDIEGFKETGCLPAGCPDLIEQMSEAQLNQAYRAWLRKTDAERHARSAKGTTSAIN